MRKHAHLPAMMGFVRNHVAQHLHAHRPRLRPSVPHKLLHAAPAAKRLTEHLRAARGALGQSRTGLPRRALRVLELHRNLQVRRRKPDPHTAHIVHVRKDRRNRPHPSGRFRRQFRIPRRRIKPLDQHLVHALVSRKHPHCSPPELRVNPIPNLVVNYASSLFLNFVLNLV